MYRNEIILQLGAVEQQYRAAALAVGDLLARALPNPTLIRSANVVLADLRLCRDNLEITYLVRMFAIFEHSLQTVRRVVYGRTTPIKAYDLLQQCAARQHVPSQHLVDAHRVRNFRNSVIHGGIAPPVSLPQARQWLCIFFGWMPPQW